MKNFFSLLLALMFSCTFTVCAFAAEPYAENSNPPTLQDTLQEILDNPTYSNAYKEAAKKKCDYLMSVRDSGPSAGKGCGGPALPGSHQLLRHGQGTDPLLLIDFPLTFPAVLRTIDPRGKQTVARKRRKTLP